MRLTFYMSFYVYLIISKKLDRYTSYVGYTKNVKKRLELHNKSKGAKFTRGQNWMLAYTKSYKNKSVAMSEEYKLKKNIKLRNKIKKDFINK